MAFSRDFRSTDALIQLENVLYQSTFIKERILYFLLQWPNANRINVSEVRDQNNVFYYALNLFEGDESKGQLIADFPCPDQCVPPLVPKDLTGIKVQFDVLHFFHVMSSSNCVFLNVQLAKLNGLSTQPPDSLAIYAITIENGQVIVRNSHTDLVYISETP